MTKKEREELKKLDAMLDHWEKNPTPVTPISDPKPGWDHRKYQKHIYDNRLNK